MDLQLKEKLVLVTGSTAGIGKAIARAYAREGARVIVNGRSAAKVQEVVAELGTEASPVTGIAADVGTAEGAERLYREAEAFGALDILVNNVGIFEVKEFSQTTDEDWLHYYNVNVLSAVRLARLALPAMLDRNRGSIVLMASEAGVKPLPQMIHYSVTKTALISLARGLAELTKGTGVTVNSILAGPTRTEGVDNYFTGLAQQKGEPADQIIRDYFRKDEPTSLIQRFVDVEEVAKAVLFVSTTPAINGAAQRVEGGIIRSI